MVVLQTVGGDLLRTASSVNFVFGATTALAFRRGVRDMVESKVLSSDDETTDRSPPN